jgi:hypothetical protein
MSKRGEGKRGIERGGRGILMDGPCKYACMCSSMGKRPVVACSLAACLGGKYVFLFTGKQTANGIHYQ